MKIVPGLLLWICNFICPGYHLPKMISDYFYTAFNVNRVYKEVGGRSKRDSSPSVVTIELAFYLITLVTSVTK